MKWGDSLLIKFKNEPDWGYDCLLYTSDLEIKSASLALNQKKDL